MMSCLENPKLLKQPTIAAGISHSGKSAGRKPPDTQSARQNLAAIEAALP